MRYHTFSEYIYHCRFLFCMESALYVFLLDCVFQPYDHGLDLTSAYYARFQLKKPPMFSRERLFVTDESYLFVEWYIFFHNTVYKFSYQAINLCVQYHGGFLPDFILLTQCYHRSFKCHEEFMSGTVNVYLIFPLDPVWTLRKFRYVSSFFLNHCLLV